MRHDYGVELPPGRPSAEVGRWVDVWAWLLAFALLLAAPCVPESPPRGDPGARGSVSGRRADAPRPP